MSENKENINSLGWSVEKTSDYGYSILDDQGDYVCMFYYDHQGFYNQKENAETIVTACNLHHKREKQFSDIKDILKTDRLSCMKVEEIKRILR